MFTLKTKRLIKAVFCFVVLCLHFGQAWKMEVVSCVLETGVDSFLCSSLSLSLRSLGNNHGTEEKISWISFNFNFESQSQT